MLTDAQIEQGKRATKYTERKPLHEHPDCIRIAYQWLDAQKRTAGRLSKTFALKHIIEEWGGRYVSQSDVEVAAQLHPDINGTYPHFNISARLTEPSRERLKNISEAFTQSYNERHDPSLYSQSESGTPSPSLTAPSTLESVAGSAPSEVALSVLGALAGGPLAPLLPVLAKSLAATRQHGRVVAALTRIDQTLREHAGELERLTDEQYRLVNEAVLAVLQTTNERKLAYLRNAVRNALAIDHFLPQESVVLGRIIRDISAEEAAFLFANFNYERVQLAKVRAPDATRALTIDPDSSEGTVVVGLISLGLLSPAEPTFDESGLLRFSPIVAKLLVLLREP